jgi:hypothetical protein
VNTLWRKVGLSFVAMLCGWVACNIGMWIIAIAYESFEEKPSPVSYSGFAPAVAAVSGLVIAAVWLLIFLPVDLFVSEESALRKWRPALLHGFGWGAFSAVLYCVVIGAINPGATNLLSLLLLSFLAGTTGAVAALVRIVLERKPPHQS